jgi:hypothetical protein
MGESLAGSQSNVVSFDVSSYGQEPYCRLSPFTYSDKFQIPVPGMDKTFSNSVEGIWQGLKIINGSIDAKLFSMRPRKRKGAVKGHKYGNDVLGFLDARLKVYIPAYTHYLDNYAPKEAIDDLLQTQRDGIQVLLYDVEQNNDIRNPSPLAHSAVLATYLNQKIFTNKIEPKSPAEHRLFSILDSGMELWEKVRILRPLLDNKDIRAAFKYRCVEHPSNMDDYHIAGALGALND